MNDLPTIVRLTNLQLVALANLQTQMADNTSRLIRIENKMESMAQNVDRLNRKANHEDMQQVRY